MRVLPRADGPGRRTSAKRLGACSATARRAGWSHFDRSTVQACRIGHELERPLRPARLAVAQSPTAGSTAINGLCTAKTKWAQLAHRSTLAPTASAAVLPSAAAATYVLSQLLAGTSSSALLPISPTPLQPARSTELLLAARLSSSAILCAAVTVLRSACSVTSVCSNSAAGPVLKSTSFRTTWLCTNPVREYAGSELLRAADLPAATATGQQSTSDGRVRSPATTQPAQLQLIVPRAATSTIW
jgi:hypothetical protein